MVEKNHNNGSSQRLGAESDYKEEEGKNLKLPLNIWKTVGGHVKESLNLFSVIPGKRD